MSMYTTKICMDTYDLISWEIYVNIYIYVSFFAF